MRCGGGLQRVEAAAALDWWRPVSAESGQSQHDTVERRRVARSSSDALVASRGGTAAALYGATAYQLRARNPSNGAAVCAQMGSAATFRWSPNSLAVGWPGADWPPCAYNAMW